MTKFFNYSTALGRLVITLGLGLLVMAVSLWVLPASSLILAFVHGGYWLILGLSILWGLALWRVIPTWAKEERWTRRDLGWAVGVIPLVAVLLVHEPTGFKILMDEIQLLGTSMAMHFQRMVGVPQRGVDMQGIFEFLAMQPDKRPLFFPFLLSGLHDIIGYRPENAFLLNGLLLVVLMGLTFLAGRALAGPAAGWVSCLAWAGLPLLGQNARGGGFELLNIVMILAVGLLAGWYYKKRDESSMFALIFGGMLLAQTRYESPLFLGAVAIVIGMVWWEDRKVVFPAWLMLCPLFLAPVLWGMRIFEARPEAWEMASLPGHDTVFSFGIMSENISHALSFWFSTGVEQPNSITLAVLGLGGLIMAVVTLPRIIKNWASQAPVVKVGLWFGLALLGHLLLMLGYFWGRFDDPVIRRLSLPTHLLFVMILPWLAGLAPKPGKVVSGAGVFLAVGFLVTGVPGMARQAATRLYFPALDTAWRREFISLHPERDFLVIDNESTIWITHLVSSTPVTSARNRPEAIAYNLRNRIFSGVYVFQRFSITPETGVLTVEPGYDLGERFVLETVVERTWRVDKLSRISKLKAVREANGEVITAPEIHEMSNVPDVPRQERENAFFETWLKKLP
jgi:hypothetical protein